MFLISKLLPLLILPLGLVTLLILKESINTRKITNILALVILFIFSLPITAEVFWRILESPFQRINASKRFYDLEAQDSAIAIVVLGTGRHPAPGSAQKSEWGDADRFFGGLEVYNYLKKKNQKAKLIFTGGWWPTMAKLPPEGQTLKEVALNLGINKNDILTTIPVMNTANEAKAVAMMLSDKSKVILVTSGFHMQRALKKFQDEGLRPIPFPVDFKSTGDWAANPFTNPLNYAPSAHGLSNTSSALRELIGRTVHRSW